MLMGNILNLDHSASFPSFLFYFSLSEISDSKTSENASSIQLEGQDNSPGGDDEDVFEKVSNNFYQSREVKVFSYVLI